MGGQDPYRLYCTAPVSPIAILPAAIMSLKVFWMIGSSSLAASSDLIMASRAAWRAGLLCVLLRLATTCSWLRVFFAGGVAFLAAA